MDRNRFWQLVEQAAGKGGGDGEEMVERLYTALAKLPLEEIAGFDSELRRTMNDAYTWPLWGAAFVMNGGCSDDGFEYFRGWLIAQGREVFERAVADPESLAAARLKFTEDGMELESLLYAPDQAYEDASEGEELPFDEDVIQDEEPRGERWEEDDLEKLYPRLMKKFASEWK